MGNLTKNHKKREISKATIQPSKQSKQSTLDNINYQFNIPKPTMTGGPTKAIVINAIINTIKEDELVLNVDFTLLPSKASFSRINVDLYFQEQLLNSTTLGIPQSTLLNDQFDYPVALDMRGIKAGNYLIRVEMYELWSTDEKLNFTVKSIVIDYVPQTREARLVKIPTVKSVAGSNLTVVSSGARDIFRDLQQESKKEVESKRDEW